jgi:hypothetical protein
MKLQPRKELLASDNSGLLLYYPQLRTNDFVSFFFCYTAASKIASRSAEDSHAST